MSELHIITKTILERKKHPAGLSVLFMTEVWERFGFYIVQGMLILYMTQNLNFSDKKSDGILGAFTALAYMLPVLGGYIADKISGFRKAIMIGGIFLCFGYAFLALSSEYFFYFTLAIIVIGTGLFKANVSSLLGVLYKKDNPTRRDAGFTLFYVGINIGILLATLSSGFIEQKFGWSVTFAMASVGLLLGVTTFWLGQKKLEGKGLPPRKMILPKWAEILFKNKFRAAVVLLISIAGFGLLMMQDQLASILFALVGISLVCLIISMAFNYKKEQRNKILGLLVLLVFAVIYWAVFFQMFFATELFTLRLVDRHLGSIIVPPVAFISLEGIIILFFGPTFARFWQFLAKKNLNPSTGMKFALALFLAAAAFYLLVMSINFSQSNSLVNMWWVVGSYFLLILGEILLSPIGLSVVTRLSPPEHVGMMMGVWFFTLGYGGQLTGLLAKMASVSPQDLFHHDKMAQIYHNAFLHYAEFALIGAILLLLITPILKKVEGKL